jgi:anoctamin-8
VVVLAMAAVSVMMYFAFTTRDTLEEDSIREKKASLHLALDQIDDLVSLMDWDFWFYLFITPIMYGLLIPLLDQLFTRLAYRLTAWENHETDSAFQSHLILKVFPFRFVHVFASLYYYAFASGNNLLRVAIQLAAFLVAGQVWNNVMETGFPLLRRRVLRWRKNRATGQHIDTSPMFRPQVSNGTIQEQCRRLEQATAGAWEESALQKYNTFDDYTEMLIQFGYVSFFSIAFPLAPLLALLNNLVELRTDAFKLCHTKQRPLARKGSGIGIWFSVLQSMSVLAVITNCMHIAFTTTQIEQFFPADVSRHKVWVVFVAEHVILLLKVWIAWVIPEVPRHIREAISAEKRIQKQETIDLSATG